MAQSKLGVKKSASLPPKKMDFEGALRALEATALNPKWMRPEKVVAGALSQIETALENGYSFTDIARTFVEHGVKISVSELKQQYEAQTEPSTASAQSRQSRSVAPMNGAHPAARTSASVQPAQSRSTSSLVKKSLTQAALALDDTGA